MEYKKLKKFILKITPKKVLNLYQDPIKNQINNSDIYSTLSFSQEGEDLIIKRIFEGQKTGFYVDVGAHHPKRFSNTYLFYKMGWQGINIDAMPESMNIFKIKRPRDINLEIGVSNEQQELVYYMFNEPALNTFSEDEAKNKDGLRNYKIIDKIKIKTSPLKSILDEYLPKDCKIDFMSIDVEGFDLQVIESNDWEKYRPTIILIEDLKKYAIVELTEHSEIYKFLIVKDYQFIAKTFNTLFFKDIRS